MGPILSFLQGFSVTSPDVLAVVFTILGYAAWRLYRLVSFVYLTPLRILPGPPAPSLVYGNLNEFAEVEGSFFADQMFAKYGKTYVDREFFMVRRGSSGSAAHDASCLHGQRRLRVSGRSTPRRSTTSSRTLWSTPGQRRTSGNASSNLAKVGLCTF